MERFAQTWGRVRIRSQLSGQSPAGLSAEGGLSLEYLIEAPPYHYAAVFDPSPRNGHDCDSRQQEPFRGLRVPAFGAVA
jgi:hypothetical protein